MGARLQECPVQGGSVEVQGARMVSAGAEQRHQQMQAEPGANIEWCTHHLSMLLVEFVVSKSCSAGPGWADISRLLQLLPQKPTACGLFSSSLTIEPSGVPGYMQIGDHLVISEFRNITGTSCCDPHLFSLRGSSVRNQESLRWKKALHADFTCQGWRSYICRNLSPSEHS